MNGSKRTLTLSCGGAASLPIYPCREAAYSQLTVLTAAASLSRLFARKSRRSMLLTLPCTRNCMGWASFTVLVPQQICKTTFDVATWSAEPCGTLTLPVHMCRCVHHLKQLKDDLKRLFKLHPLSFPIGTTADRASQSAIAR